MVFFAPLQISDPREPIADQKLDLATDENQTGMTNLNSHCDSCLASSLVDAHSENYLNEVANFWLLFA